MVHSQHSQYVFAVVLLDSFDDRVIARLQPVDVQQLRLGYDRFLRYALITSDCMPGGLDILGPDLWEAFLVPAKPHRLSKTQFMAGLHCERRLWMLFNRPNDGRELTLAEQRRMQIGTEFGRDVTKLFPGGVEITADHGHPQEALDATAAQLDCGAPALFEAAFLHHEILIRPDILKRSEADPDAWELIEVKSASNSAGNDSSRRPKLKKHVSDMAVQLHVMEGAGITVESISLAWVNSNYERVDELDWDKLVAIEDHSEDVRSRAVNIGDEINNYLAIIDQPAMPDATYGKTKCDECEFNHICWGDEPEDSIIHLPYISAKKLRELGQLDVKCIPDIPSDYDLSPKQVPVLEAYNYPNGKLVERRQLEQWIEKLVYPLYFFDFESWNPCIPPFDNTRPYKQIPFQYSLHIQETPDSELDHREFLAKAEGDPRPVLIEQLVDDLGTAGSIVVHSAAFEKGRICELAVFSRGHKNELTALLDRIVDTEIPFKRNWYLHPGLMGRSSIKVVLPTLVPELGYEGMKIADGMTAAIRFEEMREGKVVGRAAESVRENLIEYCRMDTLAMVRIVGRLREMVE